MTDCSSIDPLVTPFVDGELSPGDRAAVAGHVSACLPCRQRVQAEQSVRDALRAQRPALQRERAPSALRARCADLARDNERSGDLRPASRVSPFARPGIGLDSRLALPVRSPLPLRRRLAPFALAATLVLIVGGAFLSRMTDASAKVMAAELTADHLKCFAMNGVLGTNQSASTVEASLASSFGWPLQVPDGSRTGLTLVGSRPCLYGKGRVAHLMFTHEGRPISLFMLPDAMRSEELVEVLGHEAAIWCTGNRTFVLVGRETPSEIERLAALVHDAVK